MAQKIVVASQDQDLLLLLEKFLTDEGFDVECLTDGARIINGSVGAPEMFNLDKELRSIDGIATCKFLKVHDRTEHIPVIIISSNHLLKQKAIGIGAAGFLEKPFEFKSLMHLVESTVGK